TGKLLRVSRRHPTVLRIALLASIFGSFAFGACIGTLVGSWDHGLAMLPPVLFVLWICYVDRVTPIADVREIDQLADPEFTDAGLVRTLLPPELGIYRLWCHHDGKQHRSPNFSAWI